MDITKLNPWNWFQKEEQENTSSKVPVQSSQATINQYRPLLNLHQEIDRMFDNAVRAFGFPTFDFGARIPSNMNMSELMLIKPNIDIAANKNNYVITVEVPGVKEEDVKIELSEDRTLIITGEKKQEKTEEEEGRYRTERMYGSFRRVLSLPTDADMEKIEATFKNGVLSISLPRKATATSETRHIEIQKSA